MRKVVTGEELAQLYNPDPFAMPRWRAPVYRTPFGIILLAKFARLLGWITRLIFRHPLAASVLALTVVIWVKLGRLTLVALVLGPAASADGSIPWRAWAFGDACLFVVRDGRVCLGFPIADPQAFAAPPQTLRTKIDVLDYLAKGT